MLNDETESARHCGLDRRHVLGGIGAVAATGLISPAWAKAGAPIKLEARAAVADGRGETDLTWMPMWKIRDLIALREISPVEVTNHFLARIEALDPILKAFYKVDYAGAREQAARAEKAVLAREPLGPLHGIPIGIKGLVPIKGLPAWQGIGKPMIPAASQDSIAAERLRKAGAIMVGTTYVLFGPKSPWDITREPGVSSSGSAAAMASGMLTATIGSDGAGSTRIPAALSGLVGLYGTRGRVPDLGANNAPSADGGVGPITRTVRDAAILFQTIAGPDPRNPLSLPDDPPDYLFNLDKGIEGWRLGWTDDFGYANQFASPETPAVIAKIRNAANRATAGGATVEEIREKWDGNWADMFSVADLIMSPNLVGRRQENWDKFARVFKHCDLILSPTMNSVAPRTEEWSDWAESTRDMSKVANFAKMLPRYGAYTGMVNFLGLTAASVPVGFVNGLPVGLQIIGPPNSEARVLQMASAIMKLV